MKKNSLNINVICVYLSLFFTFIIFAGGCYSFTGGAVPEHLKTLYIATVEDNSGFGNPQYRDFFAQKIHDKFRDDNSFEIVESNGDARLEVTISRIDDQVQTVNGGGGTGELENQRKITVRCEALYYDVVKNKKIWSKSFSNFGVYDVNNSIAGRDEAVQEALDQNADDVLLAVVSGW